MIAIYAGGCRTSVLGCAEGETNNLKETQPDTDTGEHLLSERR